MRVPTAPPIESLLDHMKDGQEYGSVVDKIIPPNFNLMNDVVRGILAIQVIRGRPCLLYVGNISTKDGSEAGVDAKDDVPFQELVGSVPPGACEVDIFLATNGGSGEQVSRFVNYLRQRFDDVNFLIPSACMSAGTLFALSGEKIFMGSHAFLGPIDPQVPSASGRFVPAQALLILVNKLRDEGQQSIAKGAGVPWTHVRLIDSLDKRELGAAITATEWSRDLAVQYLLKYKFKDWTARETSGTAVTPEYKAQRAKEIADALASHEKWKNHGHSISRDVLWDEIKLKIDHPDVTLERAMNRLWAVLTWVFDKSTVQKVICGELYRYARMQNVLQLTGVRP